MDCSHHGIMPTSLSIWFGFSVITFLIDCSICLCVGDFGVGQVHVLANKFHSLQIIIIIITVIKNTHTHTQVIREVRLE